ncbi:beta-glucosidase-like SFR2, partial [Striga asiatica]
YLLTSDTCPGIATSTTVYATKSIFSEKKKYSNKSMTLPALLVTATKLAGALVSVTVVANTFSFSRFKRKSLAPFESPIDESADILAEFNINPTSEGEKGFFFGLATAPAHVEDRLNDAWLQFAEENPCDQPESQKAGPEPADAVLGSASADGGAQRGPLLDRESSRSMKRKKKLRLAMEASIRGFEKYEESEEPESGEGCHHTVASWHNVPHPNYTCVWGVPILGYLFWTISDNWEWADGYGPKFGLVAVDRFHNLERSPRPSYDLFSKIVKSGKIERLDRTRAWRELQSAAKERKKRPFYRAVNKHGLMYAGGLDKPILRPYIVRDWRFGHYEMEGLQDTLSRMARFVLRPFSLKKKAKPLNDYEELALEPLHGIV